MEHSETGVKKSKSKLETPCEELSLVISYLKTQIKECEDSSRFLSGCSEKVANSNLKVLNRTLSFCGAIQSGRPIAAIGYKGKPMIGFVAVNSIEDTRGRIFSGHVTYGTIDMINEIIEIIKSRTICQL